ncbi:MAG: hypothetical protein ACYC9L_16530 [Sulfuricaulis sp.]
MRATERGEEAWSELASRWTRIGYEAVPPGASGHEHLKQWQRGSTMYTALVGMGASPSDARIVANNSRCWWANSRYRLNRALPIGYFNRLGVPTLS